LAKKTLSKETETNKNKMPIDFIDQLSKFEKEPYWNQMPFVS
jgi:hypothetical protein